MYNYRAKYHNYLILNKLRDFDCENNILIWTLLTIQLDCGGDGINITRVYSRDYVVAIFRHSGKI